MKCKKCGAELPEGAAACPSCGEPVPVPRTVPRTLFMTVLVALLVVSLICGIGYAYLRHQVTVVYSRGVEDGQVIGQADGYAAGHEEGLAAGIEEGTTLGFTEGKEAGYEEGYEAGKTDGFASGKEEGYASGKEEGLKSGTDAAAKSLTSVSKWVTRMLNREMEDLDNYMGTTDPELVLSMKRSIIRTSNTWSEALSSEFELDGIISLDEIPAEDAVEPETAAEVPAEDAPVEESMEESVPSAT